ncbi:arginine repressor [Anaerosoma tenue]|uniref:arginine repressor n=1 Tax=Anaerosoma tenue TaxID=2933588 RepID=UPI002260A70E|nr:ArgR family transcriptional regulator [Anaerosoma tenue]MCK8114492.1 ArgR family transcriptional regulator [Anaerosoma tenue]
MRKRTQRQDAIRTIVRRERIRTQRDLVEHLKQAGFSCTQATVSRDIADMGLRKLPEGVYVLAEDIHLQRMIAELVEDVVRSQQLVLVKTTAGGGQGVAAALDAASIDKILGSIAGDDTILIVTADETAAQAIVKGLDKFRGRN